MKTDCSPKRFRKYQERLETHRTSRSLVMTPDCSIDLKRIVSGNGSFTVYREGAVSNIPCKAEPETARHGDKLEGLTNDEAREEGVDPAHN